MTDASIWAAYALRSVVLRALRLGKEWHGSGWGIFPAFLVTIVLSTGRAVASQSAYQRSPMNEIDHLEHCVFLHTVVSTFRLCTLVLAKGKTGYEQRRSIKGGQL